MSDNRPIGVFDSGVGGLTVLRALQERLPLESTIYVGDLARCPYGPRPQEEVARFAVQIADLLAQEAIKLLVVACNTATAAAYTLLQTRYPFPVIGVVEPGAHEAAHRSPSGRIGVIATNGTVASQAYVRAVLETRPDAVVVQRAASWLVPEIERGALARAAIAAQLRPTVAQFREHSIDTLILGCTHFPLVRDIFDAACTPDIDVVDSAQTTASMVEDVLVAENTLAAAVPFHRFLVTGPAEAFAERAQMMFRASPPIETIDLAASLSTS